MRASARRQAAIASSRCITAPATARRARSDRPRVELERVDRAALLDERPELLVDRHVARERLVADLREAARAGGHEDAGPVQDEVRLEALADEPRRREQVHEAD